MTIAMVAAALRSFADGTPDGTVRIPASYALRLAEALLQAQDSQPAQVAQPSNRPAFVAGPADAGSHETLEFLVVALPNGKVPIVKRPLFHERESFVLEMCGIHGTDRVMVVSQYKGGLDVDSAREWLFVRQVAAPSSADAGSHETGICMFCDGCGWCEGSPAFTCPRCKGTGEAA